MVICEPARLNSLTYKGVGSQCLFLSTSISMFLRTSHSRASSWPCSSMRRELTNGGCSGSRMKWLSPTHHSYFLPRFPAPTRAFAFSRHPGSYRWLEVRRSERLLRSREQDACVRAPIRRCSASVSDQRPWDSNGVRTACALLG